MALETINSTTFSTATLINNSAIQGIAENSKKQKKIAEHSVNNNEEQSAKLEVSSFNKLTVNTSDDINMQKVEYIKAAIKNGELSLDVSKIADSLLQELSSPI